MINYQVIVTKNTLSALLIFRPVKKLQVIVDVNQVAYFTPIVEIDCKPIENISNMMKLK